MPRPEPFLLPWGSPGQCSSATCWCPALRLQADPSGVCSGPGSGRCISPRGPAVLLTGSMSARCPQVWTWGSVAARVLVQEGLGLWWAGCGQQVRGTREG